MSHEDPTPDSANLDGDSLEQLLASRSPAGLSCPDCGGSLWQMNIGDVKRYQCHVGHAFLLESLLKGQGEEIERHLWIVLRLLQEQVVVARQLATEARSQNRPIQEIEQLEVQTQQTLQQIERVRQVLHHNPVSAVLDMRYGWPLSDP